MTVMTAESSKIYYGQELIEFHITRTNHLEGKILIHVEPSGEVIVEAPPDTRQGAINDAVRKRARWIVRQLDSIHQYKTYVIPRSYISGETYFYLGRRYVLKVVSAQDNSVKLLRGRLIVSTEQNDKESVKELLSKWYRDHAFQYLQKRLTEIARNMSWLDEIPSVRLLNMQKQWGSCSPRGTIILNPSLIKAPRECVDYVILHEICHLREHNHSNRFYELLSRNMPDWKVFKSKLDAMAEMLLIE